MISQKKMHLITLFAMLALTLAAFSLGCGKKSWPEPQATGERFDFKNVQGVIKKGCLSVRAGIGGKGENLAKIVLELAETGTAADCPTCPFTPTQRIEFPLTADGLKYTDKRLLVEHCGLNPDGMYRWRLVGYNAYPGIRPIVSAVIMSSP